MRRVGKSSGSLTASGGRPVYIVSGGTLVRNVKQSGLGLMLGMLGACSGEVRTIAPPSDVNDSLLSNQISVAIVSAGPADCAMGGTVIVTFRDFNANGVQDLGEASISSSKVCNGANGATGATGATGPQGVGAGIEVSAALPASCPAGGSIFKTFVDLNNNGLLDGGESYSSVSTLCNGSAGSNGISAYLSQVAASPSQCVAGGVVYTSHVDGQPNQVSVVCNGQNGQDGQDGQNGTNGQDAIVRMGAVGPAVVGKSYSACHHDYLYIPDAHNGDRGWLNFRHQRNGSADQGIGSTGFQVWNVDINNFALASEVGNRTYCTLQWDPVAKQLSFTVVDNDDGLAGTTGQIQF